MPPLINLSCGLLIDALSEKMEQPGGNIYHNILCGIAYAIKNGDPVEEIRDMIINNWKFKEAIKKWKENVTGLNILQLAILFGDIAVISLFKNEFDFSYETEKYFIPDSHEPYPTDSPYWAQQHTVLGALFEKYKLMKRKLFHQETSMDLFSADANSETVESRLWDSIKVNSPVHLACKLGNLEVLKLLLPNDDLIEVSKLIYEKSILRLDNVELIHSGVFKKKSGAKIAQSCGDNIAESSSANLEVMDFINTEDIVEQEEGEENYNLPAEPATIHAASNKDNQSNLAQQSTSGNNQSNSSSQSSQSTSFDSQSHLWLQSTSGNNQSNSSSQSISGDSQSHSWLQSTSGNNQSNSWLQSTSGTTAEADKVECSSQLHSRSLQQKEKTAFDICVEEQHLECCVYIAHLLFACNGNDILFKVKHKRQYRSLVRNPERLPYVSAMNTSPTQDSNESTMNLLRFPLHKACSLDSPSFLRLLLEKGGYSRLVNSAESEGYPPLYKALHCKNTGCVRLLLQHGARVNVAVNHQTPLHWLFEDCFYGKYSNDQVENLEKVKLLISSGANVNAQDSNSNTALDYIVADYGKVLSGYYNRNDMIEGRKIEETMQQCVLILLDAGAHITVSVAKQSAVILDHTVGHTFLLNCSWPVSPFMVRYPESVYSLLQIFFQYGLDPNILPVYNETNLLSQLICNCLKPLQIEMQKKFLHLFSINGADFNRKIPPPHHAMEAGTIGIRIWNVCSLILALQERILISVIETICEYMSLTVLNECIRIMSSGHMWSRIHTSPPGVDHGKSKYKSAWEELVQELTSSARPLRHCCKLTILECLDRQGSKVNSLPLPTAIRNYLLHIEC